MKYRDIKPGQIFRFVDDEPDIVYIACDPRSHGHRQCITQIQGNGAGHHAITDQLAMDDHEIEVAILPTIIFPADDTTRRHVRSAAYNGEWNMIAAIKEHRTITGSTLKAAKDYVETHCGDLIARTRTS